MGKRLKPIPSFTTEAEERDFWVTHDSTAYVDWSQARRVVLPNLKPTTRTISLRLPQHLLDAIKAAANARDVPYQSLSRYGCRSGSSVDSAPEAGSAVQSCSHPSVCICPNNLIANSLPIREAVLLVQPKLRCAAIRSWRRAGLDMNYFHNVIILLGSPTTKVV